MKSWDVIIVGGGIIGLSLAIALRKRNLRILVVDRSELGREASYAAGGMLADCLFETPAALQSLATVSARMYPEFVRDLEDESGIKVDLRDAGTILFPASEHVSLADGYPLPGPVTTLEPNLAAANRRICFLPERSVDPRLLVAASIKAAKRRGVDTSAGDTVISIDVENGKTIGATTAKTKFHAACIINCAGAWASQLGEYSFPTRPVKGQMLAVLAEKNLVRHVIRASEAYIIPRSDGRIVIGATLEEAGYDKRTIPETIQGLLRGAVSLVPKLAESKLLEDWAGLRPGTPDGLPIMGPSSTPGYFVATGHYRDGILLAPITARLMAQVVCGESPELEIGAFAPTRFVPQFS